MTSVATFRARAARTLRRLGSGRGVRRRGCECRQSGCDRGSHGHDIGHPATVALVSCPERGSTHRPDRAGCASVAARSAQLRCDGPFIDWSRGFGRDELAVCSATMDLRSFAFHTSGRRATDPAARSLGPLRIFVGQAERQHALAGPRRASQHCRPAAVRFRSSCARSDPRPSRRRRHRVKFVAPVGLVTWERGGRPTIERG